jgi:hypothetical protein
MEKEMSNRIVTLALASGLLVVTGTALADHNSKNGEGWANMPNDIHNTRVETREADDNEAFREFVKYGNGSTTENRFATDDEAPTQAKGSQGNAQGSQVQGSNAQGNQAQGNQVQGSNAQGSQVQNKQAVGSKEMTQSRDRQRLDTGDGTMTQTRSEIRDRLDASSMSRSDRASRASRSNRGGGRR